MIKKEKMIEVIENTLNNLTFCEGIPLFDSQFVEDFEISDSEGSINLLEFINVLYENLSEVEE